MMIVSPRLVLGTPKNAWITPILIFSSCLALGTPENAGVM